MQGEYKSKYSFLIPSSDFVKERFNTILKELIDLDKTNQLETYKHEILIKELLVLNDLDLKERRAKYFAKKRNKENEI